MWITEQRSWDSDAGRAAKSHHRAADGEMFMPLNNDNNGKGFTVIAANDAEVDFLLLSMCANEGSEDI